MSLYRTMVRALQGSSFIKNIATLVVGTILVQVINIVSLPILSRLYTPEDFGLFAIFLAVSSIVSIFITLRYDNAILITKHDSESKTLARLSFVLAILLGFIIGIILWLITGLVNSSLGIETSNKWLILASISAILVTVINLGSNWYNRQQDYQRINKIRINQSLVNALFGISLGFLGIHSGLVLAHFISYTIMAIGLIISLSWLTEDWNGRNFKTIGIKNQNFPIYILPASLLDVATFHLPVILITLWFSSEIAGQYSMAFRILALPSALIGGAAGQVFLRKFAKIYEDKESAIKLIFNMWKGMVLIGALPISAIFLFGEELFVLVLGEAWEPSGKIAVIIAPMLFFLLVFSPTSGVFQVLGLQRFNLYFGISVLIYRPACIWIGFLANNLTLGLIILTICEGIQILIYSFVALKNVKGL
jgi:lipopolysaccharide exporter